MFKLLLQSCFRLTFPNRRDDDVISMCSPIIPPIILLPTTHYANASIYAVCVHGHNTNIVIVSIEGKLGKVGVFWAGVSSKFLTYFPWRFPASLLGYKIKVEQRHKKAQVFTLYSMFSKEIPIFLYRSYLMSTTKNASPGIKNIFIYGKDTMMIMNSNGILQEGRQEGESLGPVLLHVALLLMR